MFVNNWKNILDVCRLLSLIEILEKYLATLGSFTRFKTILNKVA